MERVQSLQKMQVLARQKANLAAQLEACSENSFSTHPASFTSSTLPEMLVCM